jgi:hypothetical protein
MECVERGDEIVAEGTGEGIIHVPASQSGQCAANDLLGPPWRRIASEFACLNEGLKGGSEDQVE